MGAEYHFESPFAARIEWLYYRLDGQPFQTDPRDPTEIARASNKGSILRLGLTYAFF